MTTSISGRQLQSYTYISYTSINQSSCRRSRRRIQHC